MASRSSSPTPLRATKAAPKRRWSPGLLIDRALAGGGVAAACCSIAFAGYMAADRNRQPHFAGQEYLAIFAKPSRPLPAPARPSPVLAEAASPSDPGRLGAVDPTPTGSIAPASSAGPPSEASARPRRYRVVTASRAQAWLETDTGFQQVKPGDVLADLGRIEAIEERDGRWVVLTEKGAALESNGGFALPGAAGPDDRFARRMIFDSGAK